jgi:hypothetical protein
MKFIKFLLLIFLLATTPGISLFIIAWIEHGFDPAAEKFMKFVDDIVDDETDQTN